MQPKNANGVPVVIIPQQFALSLDKRFPYINMRNGLAKQLIVSGSLQIVLGVLSIIFQAASMGIYRTQYRFRSRPMDEYIQSGLCFGILYIIIGPFGIVGGRRKARSHVIAYNILSIISAITTPIFLDTPVRSVLVYAGYNSDAARKLLAMETIMAVVAVIEIAVAIWSSVVCCKIESCCCDCEGECCCPPSKNIVQVYASAEGFDGQLVAVQNSHVIGNGYDSQQPIFMTNQQQMAADKTPLLSYSN